MDAANFIFEMGKTKERVTFLKICLEKMYRALPGDSRKLPETETFLEQFDIFYDELKRFEARTYSR